eukprot:2751306-Karenia_brevis.AAC.1
MNSDFQDSNSKKLHKMWSALCRHAVKWKSCPKSPATSLLMLCIGKILKEKGAVKEDSTDEENHEDESGIGENDEDESGIGYPGDTFEESDASPQDIKCNDPDSSSDDDVEIVCVKPKERIKKSEKPAQDVPDCILKAAGLSAESEGARSSKDPWMPTEDQDASDAKNATDAKDAADTKKLDNAKKLCDVGIMKMVAQATMSAVKSPPTNPMPGPRGKTQESRECFRGLGEWAIGPPALPPG